MKLSDEDLADISMRVARETCYRCDGLKYEQPGLVCVACDGTGAFSLSTTIVLLIISELRARRSQNLTAEQARDAQLLLDNYRALKTEHDYGLFQWERDALANLSKLLGRTEGR